MYIILELVLSHKSCLSYRFICKRISENNLKSNYSCCYESFKSWNFCVYECWHQDLVAAPLITACCRNFKKFKTAAWTTVRTRAQHTTPLPQSLNDLPICYRITLWTISLCSITVLTQSKVPYLYYTCTPHILHLLLLENLSVNQYIWSMFFLISRKQPI